MLETLKNAWRIPELRKKLLYIGFILIIFRLGASIPVPFIDVGLLQQYFAGDAGNTMLGFINIFTGGGLSNATLFAMSITPYINAQIIIQLLTVAIPALERLAKEGGEEGREKLQKWTRYLGVGLGLLQGYSYYVLLRSQQLLTDTSFWAGFVIVVTFTAGTAMIMWLGEHITKHGLGNGISIILFAGIVSRGPEMFQTLWSLFTQGGKYYAIVIAMIIISLALVVFIVFMYNAERRIPVQYAKRVVGRKMYGGQSSHIPIKVAASGVMPLIFASSILQLPSTIGLIANPKDGSFAKSFIDAFASDSPLYIILYFLLILGFSYFYAAIQFNPIEIANNLRKNGGYIPGFRPGRPTSDFITRSLAKITFMGALYLAVVAILPLIVGAAAESLKSVAIGGTSVLIVIGVALETVKAIEAQMMMRHYKGFLD
jgi:preprotein translocase subunit SecY